MKELNKEIFNLILYEIFLLGNFRENYEKEKNLIPSLITNKKINDLKTIVIGIYS